MKKIYEYKFWIDFNSSGWALTLGPSEVREDSDWTIRVELTKTHPDGWTIKWSVSEDYYEWVNSFEATHPTLWKVWWDFEDTVFATKRKWFKDFYKNHSPQAWDYYDI